jgi:hypothetical protein
VVECDLAKVEVAGSNPVSRSKILKRLTSGCRNHRNRSGTRFELNYSKNSPCAFRAFFACRSIRTMIFGSTPSER